MTPARLEFLIRDCHRRHGRRDSLLVHRREIVEFLQIEPITMRRWLSGHTPIPRVVEVFFEALRIWPEINFAEIDRIIAERDAGE